MKKYYLQVYRHILPLDEDNDWADVQAIEIHPQLAEHLRDLGIIEFDQGRIRENQIRRLRKLMRLKRNLGINLQAAAIILDLLERVETLQDEIENLKRR